MALKGMGEIINQFDYMYIEVNREQVYKNCPHINELDKFLSDFKRVETRWTKWNWGEAFYIREKSI